MQVDPDTLYLSAPVNALVEGIFSATRTIGDIRRHGDLALGTFNQLDGEMVMVGGEVYQVSGTGSVRPVGDEECSPFAVATFFRELSQDRLRDGFDSMEGLLGGLESLLPSLNLMHAFQVEGHFELVRTRSVPRQENYRPLVEVTREQPVFERHDVSGVLAGFYTPAFMASLNVPGFHLHFLSDDRTFGGHLLQCSAPEVLVRVQVLRQLRMDLPVSLDYLTLDFSRDTAGDLAEAESERPSDGGKA